MKKLKSFLLILALSISLMAITFVSIDTAIKKVVREGQSIETPFGPDVTGKYIKLIIGPAQNIEIRTYYVVYSSNSVPLRFDIVNERWELKDQTYTIYQRILVMDTQGHIYQASHGIIIEKIDNEILDIISENPPTIEVATDWLVEFLDLLLNKIKIL